MGTQIITQPQTFKSASTVMGAAAGLSAVSGLTVYGDISASGMIYGSGIIPVISSGTGTGAQTAFTITGYTDNNPENYLVTVGGLVQRPGVDYTVSSNTINFTTAVPNSVAVLIIAWQTTPSTTADILYVSSEGGTSFGNVTSINFADGLSASVAAGAATVHLPGANAGQVLTYDGSTSTWVASAAPGIGASTLTSGGTYTFTGQSSALFTGIPSYANRVVVSFGLITTNSTSPMYIRLGAGSIATSGYLSSTSQMGSVVATANQTTAFFLSNTMTAGARFSGAFTFSRTGVNIWTCTGGAGVVDSLGNCITYGSITLGSALDRILLDTATGNFTGGTVGITWE